MTPLLAVTPSFLALALTAAHFYRAGLPCLAAVCLVLAGLAYARKAWVRFVLLAVLPLAAARWVWIAGVYAQIRLTMGVPWQRMAVILLGVAAWTFLAALLLLRPAARLRHHEFQDTAAAQAAAFLLTFGTLAALSFKVPGLLLADRLLPGAGVLQALLLGLWAAYVARALSSRSRSPAFRMRIWRIFSLAFFAQLAIGLAGWSLFLMTGRLHLPVPGLVVLGPVVRGGSLFMPVLFGVSILLAGSAWCSHLCYFGVWDATLAVSSRQDPRPLPDWWKTVRFLIPGLCLLAAVVLRLTGAPLTVALGAGILLGLALIPCMLLISRPWGVPGYCLMVCPLGALARLLARAASWRIRRTAACVECGTCVRTCRHGALTQDSLRRGAPLLSCTLCRDCLSACPRHGLELRGWGLVPGTAETVFVTIVAVLHALFLGTARI